MKLKGSRCAGVKQRSNFNKRCFVSENPSFGRSDAYAHAAVCQCMDVFSCATCTIAHNIFMPNILCCPFFAFVSRLTLFIAKDCVIVFAGNPWCFFEFLLHLLVPWVVMFVTRNELYRTCLKKACMRSNGFSSNCDTFVNKYI